MKTTLRFSLFILVIFIVSSCNQKKGSADASPAGAADREKIATAIVDNLVKQDYSAVRNDFDKTMLDALPAEKIKEVWQKGLTSLGSFQKVISTTEEQIDGYTVIKKRCQFSVNNVTVQVTFSQANKVAGLYLKP